MGHFSPRRTPVQKSAPCTVRLARDLAMQGTSNTSRWLDISQKCPVKSSRSCHVPILSNGQNGVLSNLELMELICEDLPPKYLLSVALASKFIFEPAVNILWRTLPTLLPIIKLIPGLTQVADSRTRLVYYVCIPWNGSMVY